MVFIVCVITERLLALLPSDSQQQTANMLPARDFEVAYRLDCRNLCADFQEDIEFRFSLGITSLMQRFLGPKGRRAVLSGGSNMVCCSCFGNTLRCFLWAQDFSQGLKLKLIKYGNHNKCLI